jgi:paraquat-inducible protein B
MHSTRDLSGTRSGERGKAKPDDLAHSAELPEATTKKPHWFTPIWLMPLLALGLVGWLVYRDTIQSGPSITIRFKEGKGIVVSTTVLQYRGVKIGKVTSIGLSKDQQLVEVKAKLDKSAEGIAQQGSQFWIVHPEVSGAQIRGLQTIVSGEYIQVNPGRGAPQTEFMGLEDQPVLTTDEEGGLTLVLLATQLNSVENGSPVLYRGMQVGEVMKYQLGRQAQTVEIVAYIQKQFAPLVRKNSMFWNAGGVNLKLSLLHGADLSAQSLQTLVGGGIAFATPNQYEDPASNGTAFRLYDKPQDEWLNWFPSIVLSTNRSPIEMQRP